MGILFLVGCRCAPVEQPPSARPHFGGWESLVRLAGRGEVALVREAARDVVAGDLENAPGAAAVGGALGFLQMAADADEVAEGVAEAAAACGGCHEARAVEPPPRPVWSHDQGASWLVWGVVWGRPGPPPVVDEPGRAVALAWGEPGPEAVEPLAAALRACAECHGQPIR